MKRFGFACTAAVAAVLAGLPANAQPATPDGQAQASAPRGVRTRLITLGTGAGPTVRKLRSQPANLLVVDGRPYLIDAGEGVIRQLAWAGYQPSQVEKVFITHLHFDHTADLASFMAFDWTNRRATPVDIYGPPGTEALTKAGLAYFAIPEAIFSQELPPGPPMASLFRAHDLDVTSPKLVYQDDKVRVFAVENSHYVTMKMAKQPYGTPKSYAYRFETPDRVVVFTGDSGPSPALTELAKGADVLVSEVIDIDETVALIKRSWHAPEAALQPLIEHMRREHLAPEEVGKLAAEAGVKMVVLTHQAPGLDEDVNASAIMRGVREHYAGVVVPARDLDQF